MQFYVEMIGLTVLVPAGASLAAIVVALLLCRDEPGERDVAIYAGGSVAVSGAFVLAYTLFPWAPLFPSDMQFWHWLPAAAVVMSVLGFLGLVRGVPSSLLWLLRAASTFGLAWLLLPNWEEAATWRPWAAVVLTANCLAMWWPAESLARRVRGWPLPAVLSLSALAAVLVIERSHWAQMTQLAAVVLCCLLVLTLASGLHPRRAIFQGVIAPVSLLLPAMLMQAWFNTFSPISLAAFVLVSWSPALGIVLALALASEGIRLKRLWPAVAAAILLPMAGVAVAFWSTHSSGEAL